MNDDGYHNLCNAVIIQAIKDHRSAVRKNNKDEIERIERFFRSRYFSFYSDLDGEDVLRRLKKYEDNS